MPLRVAPFAPEYIPAVRAFNQRMRGSGVASFDLPEEPRGEAGNRLGLIHSTEYLVTDGAEVRGGILAVDLPAWLAGASVAAANYQSPLSEGLRDHRYSSAGPMLIRFAERRCPLAYMVGMGADSSPLARLLKAAGWSVELTPFLFRVHRASRFLAELRVARSTPLRSVISRLAGATGAAAAALAVAQRRRSDLTAFSVRTETAWGAWADEIWDAFRPHCSFAMRRDRATLGELFPPNDARLSIFVVERGGAPAGWAACFDSQMQGHPHFGDLRVGSIVDCAAAPDAMAATAALADRELARRGVDLVVTNQSHHAVMQGFRAAGFLSGPSNYVVALSRPLAAAVGGRASIHVTRGDGDGRIHL
jgi:hypothetical protein